MCKCTHDPGNQTIILVFSHYDTLLSFVKPGFINPNFLEKQDIPLEKLLESEAAGMALPEIKCGNNWFYFHNGIEVHMGGPFKLAYVLRLQDLGGPGYSEWSQFTLGIKQIVKSVFFTMHPEVTGRVFLLNIHRNQIPSKLHGCGPGMLHIAGKTLEEAFVTRAEPA